MTMRFQIPRVLPGRPQPRVSWAGDVLAMIATMMLVACMWILACACSSNPAATPRAAKRAMGDTPAPAAAGFDRAPANESPPFVAPLGPPVCTEKESSDPNSSCYVPPVRLTEDTATRKRGLEPRTGGTQTDDQLAIDAEQDRAIRLLNVAAEGHSGRLDAVEVSADRFAAVVFVAAVGLILFVAVSLIRSKTHANLPS